jgi:hypothetical protein
MMERWSPMLLAALAVSGCATMHATQLPSEAPAVAGAARFYVQPLEFAVPRPGESPRKWVAHVEKWQRAYVDGLRDYARAKLGGREVVPLAPGQTVSDGIIVEASVSAIRRSALGAFGTDHLQGDVAFVDAVSGKNLLVAKVDASSDRFGPEGWTFGGRVKFCSLNLAKGVVAAMKQGRFPQ